MPVCDITNLVPRDEEVTETIAHPRVLYGYYLRPTKVVHLRCGRQRSHFFSNELSEPNRGALHH